MKILQLLLFLFISYSSFAQYTKENVEFYNGQQKLSGTFLTPGLSGKHPVILFLHGSGNMTRMGFESYAEDYAKLGFASLYYDKRGAGQSIPYEDNLNSAYLDVLTDDALAAITYLKTRKDVDTSRIGIWGISQAGWVVTRLATKFPDLGFVVMISGGDAPPYESELFSFKQEFKKQNLSEDDYLKAVEIAESWLLMLGTGDKNQFIMKLDAIEDGSKLKELDNWLRPKIPEDKNFATSSEWVYNYKPANDIQQLKCPILLLFGEKDTDHPTELAIAEWTKGLSHTGNNDITIVNFPNAGHGIRMRENYTGDGRPPFAPGYKETLAGWLFYYLEKKD